ncbi:hypothetical protein A9Q83_11100 [Alphaproteobacteria bacterium 46_93_T64]|nr:hypothetical protein A9Q83_11100 [Alphaproteobacteria bacterium 46_93_T64]
MPKSISLRRQVRYWLEWLAVRFSFWTFRLLGQKKSSALGGWIGRKIGPRLSAHKIAINNLKLAMPELGKGDRAQIIDKMWDNLGRNASELPFIGRDTSFEDVELVGLEHLDAFVQSGKSALFVSGHYGPWELTSLAGKYCNKNVCVVYRSANNPMVEAFFQKERKGSGYNLVPKGKSGARAILAALKKNEAVALLNDQKQNSGVPIPFFGRDAMTATAIADFACRQNLPVYPMRAERLDGGKTRLTVYAPIFAATSDDRKQDVIQFLTRINVIYENWIKERPDHWFWVHNRWP